MELGFTTARAKTNFIGARPLHEKFGIENALLISPGAPDRSVLLTRMATRGRGQFSGACIGSTRTSSTR